MPFVLSVPVGTRPSLPLVLCPKPCWPNWTVSFLLILMPGVRLKCGNVGEAEEKYTMHGTSHLVQSPVSYIIPTLLRACTEARREHCYSVLFQESSFRKELCFEYWASESSCNQKNKPGANMSETEIALRCKRICSNNKHYAQISSEVKSQG